MGLKNNIELQYQQEDKALPYFAACSNWVSLPICHKSKEHFLLLSKRHWNLVEDLVVYKANVMYIHAS